MSSKRVLFTGGSAIHVSNRMAVMEYKGKLAWWQSLNERLIMALGVCGILFAFIAGVVMGSDEADEFRGMFPALVVFGDSTVDAGNNNYLSTLVKSNFAPYGVNYQGGRSTGRFTDGLIAPDLISLRLGIPFQLPYLSPKAHGEAILTGVNFASSASGWSEDTDNIWNVKGIAAQLKWYQSWKAEVLEVAGQEKGNYIVKNALHIISTGTNDWVNNYYLSSNLQNQYTADQWTTILIDLARKHIQDLYALGARNIAILALPPLGCLPEQITFHLGTKDCVQSLNDVAVDFNKKFQVMFEDLKKTLTGSRLILFDILPVFVNAFVDPQKYGFKYARTGCCGTGDLEVSYLCNRVVPTCSNPDEHIFWDSFHPTSHFYGLLTDEFFVFAKPLPLAPPTS